MMGHVITMCMWRRPKYSHEVLSSLERCEGIEKYLILVHLDGPANWAVVQVIRAHRKKLRNLMTVINSNNLGCNENTRQALSHGFEFSDYVIHVEDDVILAPDALRYFEWVRTLPHERVYSGTAWRHPSGWLPKTGKDKPADNDATARYSDGLWIWGWSTWRDKWDIINAHWTTTGDFDLACAGSWDRWLFDHLPKPVTNIAPLTSRSMNIGEELGRHCRGMLLDYWAGSPDFKRPNNYRFLI